MNTPYIVICSHHGDQILDRDEYMRQMHMPYSGWICPECGGIAYFDDANYELYLNALEQQNQQHEEITCAE